MEEETKGVMGLCQCVCLCLCLCLYLNLFPHLLRGKSGFFLFRIFSSLFASMASPLDSFDLGFHVNWNTTKKWDTRVCVFEVRVVMLSDPRHAVGQVECICV
jgi:hypothetical protein